MRRCYDRPGLAAKLDPRAEPGLGWAITRHHRSSSAIAAASLTTAVLLIGFAAQASAKTRTVTCQGTDQSCKAVVGLAGGASNERLRIALPGTSLKLISTTVRPHWVQGAYSLTGGRYSQGGARYTATLNAVQSIPKRARLTLLFEAPARSLACKSVTRDIAYLAISRVGTDQASGAFSCQQANAVTQTWALRFQAGESDRALSVNDIDYRCKVVPKVPQNLRCDGGGTRVRFAGPTGR
jgi:hypothetical protein